MEIIMVFGGFERRKTKPIQTQSYLAPRFIWGLKRSLKKQSQFGWYENCRMPFCDKDIRQ
jgi:hypothetical protein